MKKSNLQILLVLLGILILVLGYVFAYKKTQDKIDTVEDECVTLRARLAELNEKAKQKDQLLQEIEEYNKAFEKELTKYPADLNQETTVDFMRVVETKLEWKNVSIGLPRPTEFYTLGQGATDGAAAAAAVETEDDQSYRCYLVTYPVTYQGTYESWKSYLEYIANYKYFINISSLSCVRNADEKSGQDIYTGSLALNFYAVSGPNRTPEKPNVDVPNGVGNIFTGSGSVSGVVASKYDADGGEAIATDHDIQIALVKADNDTSSAGVIVAADPNREETFVTYDGNDAATLDISVYEKDGKNYVTYKIGDKQYESEILSSDLKIYVASSPRVDGDDKSGVQCNVDNTSTIPVFIKVANDDASSPRFTLGTRSGSVKVY